MLKLIGSMSAACIAMYSRRRNRQSSGSQIFVSSGLLQKTLNTCDPYSSIKIPSFVWVVQYHGKAT